MYGSVEGQAAALAKQQGKLSKSQRHHLMLFVDVSGALRYSRCAWFYNRLRPKALWTDNWDTSQSTTNDRCSSGSDSSSAGKCRAGSAIDVKASQWNKDSWTALIWHHIKSGEGRHALNIYKEMQKDRVKPSTYTFVALLKACSMLQDPDSVKRIHAEVVASGFESHLYVGSMLVDAYAKCRSLTDARHVFEKMPCPNVVSWTAMITGYAQMNKGEEALQLYTRMQQEGVVPNDRTYVSALKACSSLAAESRDKNERCLNMVRSIHADVLRAQLESDVFVSNILVDVYAKCGSLEDARLVFETMPHRTVVSWTAMMSGYAHMDRGEEALHLYTRMQQENVVPDSRTYVAVLKACSSVAESGEKNEGEAIAVNERWLKTVRAIHTDIVLKGKLLRSDVFLDTMLVDAYAKCGSLDDAKRVFEKMLHPDVVSWTAMILGYTQMDKGEEALQLYTQMQAEGVVPDGQTYVGALNACGIVAALEKGKEIHAQIILNAGLVGGVHSFVVSSLIDMYGKCGSMVDAQQVFDAMPARERDIVAWNALIAGYAHQGESEVVFALFDRMQQAGVQPNGITFLGLLTVCSHVGLVDRGRKYLEDMSREYGIPPSIKHLTCMVDLLGRSGQLVKAMQLVKGMPFQPNSRVWACVLGACQKWSHVELGKEAFECAVKLDKDDAAPYVLMSNIYAAACMRQEAKDMQAMRINSRAWKQPGWSRWTDVSGFSHVFLVGGQAHPECQVMYAKLKHLLSTGNEDGINLTLTRVKDA